MHKYMLLEVGCQIMEEPVFDTLRTKEQLGYSVFSMLRNAHGIIGLSITVNTQVICLFYIKEKNQLKSVHNQNSVLAFCITVDRQANLI